ncbi:ClpP/crotonase [Dichomitus squalens]|uniref:ClpP/crotonase n=1 Tax=Dichomitus squalens TaxID=114155 RepID=A0A4Q9MYP1_9APHY|nr:ClpP/crotonase [Dichomitus squalens]
MSYPVSFPSSNPLVTVTHPSATIWVIEMHNGADNRLTDVFLTQAFRPALDAVERHWRENWRAGVGKKDEKLTHGAVVLVGNTKQDKFFSNGLDWAGANKDPAFKTNFFPLIFNPAIHRLITFPIPIIAAVNGHSFAGGMVLAMACDYRVMTDGSKRNAWMCMNEIHFGAQIPLPLVAVLRAKASNAQVIRKVVLEGHRFTPKEALSSGLVDYVAGEDTEGVVAAARGLAEKVAPIAKSGAWGINKRELYRDVIEALARDVQGVDIVADDAAAKARL